MDIKLQKPDFIKVSQLKPGVHCYHIYAKVVAAKKSEHTTNNGRAVNVVEGTLADETGAVNFRFTGNHTTHLVEGATVAIRNGKSNVIDEHILLELDQFGRVTVENGVTIKDVNTAKNISAVVWEKAPRKNNN